MSTEVPAGVKAVVDLAFQTFGKFARAHFEQPVHLKVEWLLQARPTRVERIPADIQFQTVTAAALYLGRDKLRKVVLRAPAIKRVPEQCWSYIVTVVSPPDGFVVLGELGPDRKVSGRAVSDVVGRCDVTLTVGRGEFGCEFPPA